MTILYFIEHQNWSLTTSCGLLLYPEHPIFKGVIPADKAYKWINVWLVDINNSTYHDNYQDEHEKENTNYYLVVNYIDIC